MACWDLENPAATRGGLPGLMKGRPGIEALFGRSCAGRYYTRRTQTGFPVPNGLDNFTDMSLTGLSIIERVVSEAMGEPISDVDRRANVVAYWLGLRYKFFVFGQRTFTAAYAKYRAIDYKRHVIRQICLLTAFLCDMRDEGLPAQRWALMSRRVGQFSNSGRGVDYR
ncbi:MAG: hypothetical protein P8L31_12540 [Pseudomonadales bacterium]|nr:hypothetical protein [Pseudomonadales bacterium]